MWIQRVTIKNLKCICANSSINMTGDCSDSRISYHNLQLVNSWNKNIRSVEQCVYQDKWCRKESYSAVQKLHFHKRPVQHQGRCGPQHFSGLTGETQDNRNIFDRGENEQELQRRLVVESLPREIVNHITCRKRWICIHPSNRESTSDLKFKHFFPFWPCFDRHWWNWVEANKYRSTITYMRVKELYIQKAKTTHR